MKNIFERLNKYGYKNVNYENSKKINGPLSERSSKIYEQAIHEFHERCININEVSIYLPTLQIISSIAYLQTCIEYIGKLLLLTYLYQQNLLQFCSLFPYIHFSSQLVAMVHSYCIIPTVGKCQPNSYRCWALMMMNRLAVCFLSFRRQPRVPLFPHVKWTSFTRKSFYSEPSSTQVGPGTKNVRRAPSQKKKHPFIIYLLECAY